MRIESVCWHVYDGKGFNRYFKSEKAASEWITQQQNGEEGVSNFVCVKCTPCPKKFPQLPVSNG
jgi:hypothetical protein